MDFGEFLGDLENNPPYLGAVCAVCGGCWFDAKPNQGAEHPLFVFDLNGDVTGWQADIMCHSCGTGLALFEKEFEGE